jgi:hypothetical protein
MDGLIVALISGAFVAGIIAHIINMRIRRKLRVGRVTEFEITTQNLIESTVHRTLADRALIIKLHNGGKIFAGVQKYITVLQEYNSENLRSVRDDFQNYKVDAAYMQMINTIISEGLFIQEVNKLPEGFLKRRYEYEGIKSTVIYYINQTDHALYFGSFSTTKSFSDFVGSHEYSILESVISKIRNRYKQAKKEKILK